MSEYNGTIREKKIDAFIYSRQCYGLDPVWDKFITVCPGNVTVGNGTFPVTPRCTRPGASR